MDGVQDRQPEPEQHCFEVLGNGNPSKLPSATVLERQVTAKPCMGTLIFSDYYTKSDQTWAVLGGIGCGAIVGVRVRGQLAVWLIGVLSQSGAIGKTNVIIPSILANMFGCFVMGLCVALRPRLQPPHPSIYAGLTTGFCGCCTTFSTYNTAVVMLLLRSASLREGILCAIVAVVLGVSTAWASFMLGFSLPRRVTSPILERATTARTRLDNLLSSPATLDTVEAAVTDLTAVVQELQVSGPGLVQELPELPGKCIRQKAILYWTLLFIFLVSAIVIIANDVLPGLLMATLMAPLGAWLRYLLCMHNAGHRIPVYTLAVNLIASALSAIFGFYLDDSCGTHAPSGAVWPKVLHALSFGFCGSLSTVSSFVDEARRLAEQSGLRSFGYVAATLLGGQAVAILFLVPAYISSDGCALW